MPTDKKAPENKLLYYILSFIFPLGFVFGFIYGSRSDDESKEFGKKCALLQLIPLGVLVLFALIAMVIWGNASKDLSVWIAAFLTLAIFSFLIQDNPVYKFAEQLLVGVSAGYMFIIYTANSVIPNAFMPLISGASDILHGNTSGTTIWAFFSALLPVALGLLIITRFIPKIGWLSRWPIGFYFGAYQGLALAALMQAYVLRHIYGTFVTEGINGPEPVFALAYVGALFSNFTFDGLVHVISGPLMIVGVIATLTYFFFSKEHTGVIGGVAKVGIVFLMIGFGASFGYTVMARVSLLIGRMQFILDDWLGLIQ